MKYTPTVRDFMEWCYNRHDLQCNQKYDTRLPYSQHLRYVDAQYQKYEHLLTEEERPIARKGCAGHDLIEDARVTFNDLVQDSLCGPESAEVIYACTELRGHNRDERHAVEYYEYLAKNKIGVFVKLCDILANVKYGLLTNSSMFKKHKKEHSYTLKYLFTLETEVFKPMFEELDNIFKL